ncbi:MAG TPA: CBS domain-containing protein [Ktedonobacterales bacterium]|jgi:CBS domain-containing protein
MLTARDIMSTTLHTVTVQTTLYDLANLLSSKRISGTPVLSDDGAVIGIVTEADLISKTGATVGDIMTRSVSSVTEDTPMREIAHLLSEKDIKRVPVMRGEKLVGLVSRGDIVRAMLRDDQQEAL